MSFNNRLFALLLFLFPAFLIAQITEPGLPTSLLPENAALFSNKNLPNITLNAPVIAELRQADENSQFQGRFAAPIPTDISPENTGTWTTLPNGDAIWQCRISATDAKGLVLIFDKFSIPHGAKVFAWDSEKTNILGAYTAQSCAPSGKFLIGILHGSEVILELFEPAAQHGQSQIHLNRVDYCYEKTAFTQPAGALDFNDSYACHVNINCTQGTDYQTVKKGIARIMMTFSNGIGWCTGSLVANTSNTGDPYFLTAQHCELIGQQPDFDLWRFDFAYEASACLNPTTEPNFQSVLGCDRLAARMETDFMLLKLNPISFHSQVYFNGWNRNTAGMTSTGFVHHPVGDIKKISLDLNPPIIFDLPLNWGGIYGTSAVNTHWKTVPTVGAYQPGSSGCPLFDNQRRIRGQLHGGAANANNPCLVFGTYFGRFDISWDAGTSSATRLKDWLDPNNTNATSKDGYVPPAPTAFSISGNIKTAWGNNMANLKVNLTGGATQTVRTDANGNYQFNGLFAGLPYTISPARDSFLANGVTAFDLLNISKHILGVQALDSPWKIIASDINKSGNLSAFDILIIRKVLLGLNPNFGGTPAWLFFPSSSQFANPAIPFPIPETSISISTLSQILNNINFVGVKMGDNNNSANGNY